MINRPLQPFLKLDFHSSTFEAVTEICLIDFVDYFLFIRAVCRINSAKNLPLRKLHLLYVA